MKTILNIPFIQQKKSNSCWIACARMLFNFFFDTDISDAVIEAIMGAEGNVEGNPIIALEEMATIEVEEFTYPVVIPKYSVIKTNIENNRPFICCVKSERTDTVNYNVSGGHWILIVGFECDNAGEFQYLYVADPACDEVRYISYDPQVYWGQDRAGNPIEMYWQNSSIIKFDQAALKN